MNSVEIKNFRELHNLSQEQLANIVGKSARAVQSWEQGVRNIPTNAVLLIEKYTQGDRFNNNLIKKERKELSVSNKSDLSQLPIEEKLSYIMNENKELNEKLNNLFDFIEQRFDIVSELILSSPEEKEKLKEKPNGKKVVNTPN